MGFSLKGAISGALGGASGGWAGMAAGAALGGMFDGDEASDAKAIYDRQYQDSINLWNMQNAYNTPLQQRKRLEEAGYNPNLWYTQGNTGNAGTISQPSYPSYAQSGNSALSNLFSKLSLRSAKADVAGKEADTEYKQLQLDYLRARIDALRRGKAGVSASNAFDYGGKSHWLDLFMTQSHRKALLGLLNDFSLPEENSSNNALSSALGHWMTSSSPNSTAGMF